MSSEFEDNLNEDFFFNSKLETTSKNCLRKDLTDEIAFSDFRSAIKSYFIGVVNLILNMLTNIQHVKINNHLNSLSYHLLTYKYN